MIRLGSLTNDYTTYQLGFYLWGRIQLFPTIFDKKYFRDSHKYHLLTPKIGLILPSTSVFVLQYFLISKCLGHSSLAITEQYLREFEDAEVYEANDKMVDVIAQFYK